MESGLLGPILSVGVGTVQPGTADTSSRKFLPSDQSSTHTSCCREGVYTPATLGISGGAAGEVKTNQQRILDALENIEVALGNHVHDDGTVRVSPAVKSPVVRL